MTNDRTEIDPASVSRLTSAIEGISGPEVDLLVQRVINQLQSRSAVGIFGDVAARHLWDEYCWVLQEGPFDDDLSGFGSLSENWDSTVRAIVTSQIDNLPRHLQVFLTVYASERGPAANEYELGTISVEAIESFVMDKMAEKASCRNLDLIGPHRGDVIGYVVSHTGLVCTAVANADLLSEILASHVDTLIIPEADLSAIAAEVIDAYMEVISSETDSSPALCEFLGHFADDIKTLLTQKDVLPALEDMQSEIFDHLDGDAS
ncbi:hypothetical protein JI739_05150 [Ramlibacter sp. AW1]|uniref:Uncharacterized protein n=1 Tax=Ramlibacter aurantiacus TaxID=2801330 RepID=A0A936ZH33_9BURK|nr:hypothetical protein [Ramlibacter aurantiacus]MBL0419732.1 hypothetical protein [Ramlibacter aurantiacus]